jgi:CysZ protein
MTAKQQALGFWRGFSALFAAMRGLLAQPRAWPFALVPALVFVLLEGSIVFAAIELVKPAVSQKLGGGDGFWRELLGDVAAWGAVVITAGLGWIVSAALTPPISAPALERIVGIVEQELAVPERKQLGVLAEFWCGFRSMLLGSAVTLPIVVALTVVELVFAPAAIVTTPLKLIIGALGVAWGLFDYPLTLRGIRARQRLQFVKSQAGVVLGFGAAFALVFWLPCCGIVMLPVGVVAATRLLWEIERSAPTGLLGPMPPAGS